MDQLKLQTKIWASDTAALFLPRPCAGCDTGLNRSELILCENCLGDLPLARYHNDPNNPVEQLFWGKVPLEAASTFLLFARTGMAQRMLHRLKYKKDLDLGRALGAMMGKELSECERFASVDAYVPVPLHPRKERLRGFNQSKVLIDGMCGTWPKPIIENALQRIQMTKSQTRKGRLDRWVNVKEAFNIPDPGLLRDKHVLLIDDVVTTGATLEGCIRAMIEIPGVRVSLFTAACA